MVSPRFAGVGFGRVDPAGLAEFAAAGVFLSVGGLAAVFAGGAVCVFAFAAGVFGDGDGFACASVFAGTGTSTTPPSLGMNGLPVFGSIE